MYFIGQKNVPSMNFIGEKVKQREKEFELLTRLQSESNNQNVRVEEIFSFFFFFKKNAHRKAIYQNEIFSD